MTPLERAARALCSLDGHVENASLEGKPVWQSYLPEVRAVLKALRQSTEAMQWKGVAILNDDHMHATSPREVGQAWTAMIEAALNE